MASTEYSNEIWKDIPGWEGLYQASSLGRVRSLERYVEGVDRLGRRRAQTYPSKVLRQQRVGIGYLVVCLTRNGKSGNQYVHRLVCGAFHGESLADGLCAAHWDGNPGNNRPVNLRWATYAENAIDKSRHLRDRSRSSFRKVKVSPEQADEMMRLRKLRVPNDVIAELQGVSASTVQKYLERHPEYQRPR